MEILASYSDMRADELLASSISTPATLIEPLPTSSFRMCAPVFAANNIFLRAPPRRLMFPIPSPGNRIYLDISQSRSVTRPENSDLVPTRCTCLFHFFFHVMFCHSYLCCIKLSYLMTSTRGTEKGLKELLHSMSQEYLL